MIKTHHYNFLTIINITVTLILLFIIVIFEFKEPLSYILMGIITLIQLWNYVLSITLQKALLKFIGLANKPKPKVNINREDLKTLNNACEKLDKYRISYTIDLHNGQIHTNCTMALYTRMSLSGNLDPIIHYHIIGTDIILTYQGTQE